MSGDGIEIERKYLLDRAPDPETMRSHGGVPRRIEQVYLRPGPGIDARRVRRIVHADGSVQLVHTEKASLGGLRRREIERAIDEAEYAELLTAADPDRVPIRKTRWVVPHGPQALEIDLFESPPGLVLVEVELRAEAEAVELPGWLGPARDVSTDPAYLNANLARRAGLPVATRVSSRR